MQYLALNGFRHSLARYFNSQVTPVDRFNWTTRNASDFARTIDQPTTLIGFSDGATACLTIACHCPYITRVYCHSPMEPPSVKLVGSPVVFLFRTEEDRTPTFDATRAVFDRLKTRGTPLSMMTLPAGPPEPVRDLATFIMRKRNHQFRNCLPYLPQELIA